MSEKPSIETGHDYGELQPDPLVVEHNLAMMTGAHQGGMMQLASEESYGGNAGYFVDKADPEKKRYPQAALNGYINPLSGEIIEFNNPQFVPEELKTEVAHGPPVEFMLLLAVPRLEKAGEEPAFVPHPSWNRRNFLRLNDAAHDLNNTLTPQARATLDASIKAYNNPPQNQEGIADRLRRRIAGWKLPGFGTIK